MRIYLIIYALFQLTQVFGQEFRKINYQFNFGTTIAIPYQKSIDKSSSPTIRTTKYSNDYGYFLGFIPSYHVSQKISMYSGLNFITIQNKIHNRLCSAEHIGTITKSYLQWPFSIQYTFSEKIPITFSVGQTVAIRIQVKEKGIAYQDTSPFYFCNGTPTYDPSIPDRIYDNNISKAYTLFDIGLTARLACEIFPKAVVNGLIFTEYNKGLFNVQTLKQAQFNAAEEWKNRTLIFGLGIKI